MDYNVKNSLFSVNADFSQKDAFNEIIKYLKIPCVSQFTQQSLLKIDWVQAYPLPFYDLL